MNPRSLAALGVLIASVGGLPAPVAAQDKFNRAPPLEGVRWVPEIKLDGKWVQVRSIDGVPIREVVEFMLALDDKKMTERFAEDLVEILTKMGHPPEDTVTLVVRDAETGKEQTLDKVPLTRANRDAVRKLKIGDTRSRALPDIKPQALHAALDDLRAALDERWSYRHANTADFAAAIAALRKRVDAGVSTAEFGLGLRKVVALGIDGHAGVSNTRPAATVFLPFAVAAAGERVVAADAARTAFLADGFPYLTKIDGRDIADWLAAAAVLVPKGSRQLVLDRSLGHLENLGHLRVQLKLPEKATVEVELTTPDGRSRATATLAVARSPTPPRYGPSGGSRVLDGGVGYLRLASMDRATSVPEIRAWMPRFKDTVGLIVDVRGNGGGHRDALQLVYSYLAAPDDPPRVFTAAAYRLHREHKDAHLSERFMYRADAKAWTDAERRAVAEFAKAFKPEWELPRGHFSDWHYMALSRQADKGLYHYARPVAVLMDAGCFSATDIFLAGLKGMTGVTLLGTASGGGSALVQSVPLGPTPFVARLGSMASFQADGKLFDGNGVQPDVAVVPVPEYFISGRDNVLEEAVKRVQRR